MTILTDVDQCPIDGCCDAGGDGEVTAVCHNDHGTAGSPLTIPQEQTLRKLCNRYNVDFDASHYTPQFDLPSGWVAGWIGGWRPDLAVKPTIYVGVGPDGYSAS